MWKSKIASLAILTGVVAWFGAPLLGSDAGGAVVEGEATASEEMALFSVGVTTPAMRSVERRLTLSGTTQAERSVAAIARTGGVVETLSVRRGARVEAGDPIARLSDEGRTAALEEARARLAQRRSEFEARSALVESGILPEIERLRLESDLRSAESALAAAELALSMTLVLAPVTGVVEEILLDVGETVEPNRPIVRILALDPMLAVVDLPERRLRDVAEGARASVRLVTGEEIEGSVAFVSSRADARTRTYRTEIAIENTQGVVPDGITIEASIVLSSVEAMPVPRSALTLSSEGRLGVRVVDDDGRVAFVPVGIVADGAEDVMVDGLDAGARLIVRGQDFVEEGQIVDAVAIGAGVAVRDSAR